MGQFKSMVKMETTEPSVELKLAKGGSVKMKKGGKAEAGHKKMAMGGGAMDMMMGTPALVGRPAVNAPVRTPGKPSMAMRRKAMMAKPAMPPSSPPMGAPTSSMPPMKKGGKMAEGGKSDTAQDKAMIKKAFKQHDSQEHKGGKGTDLKLKKGGMKKMATGGVSLGNAGGFKTGGVALGNAGGFKDGGMPMKDGVPAFVGDGKGKMKKGGKMGGGMMGYATGGVTLGNAGGFKHGGKSSKKAYAAGGTVNSGKPVAMPQGRKPAASPVRISQLAGTYKRGGKVTPGESRLLKDNATENKSAMRAAKTDSNLKYGSPKRMNDGGTTSGQGSITDREHKTMQDLSKGAYDKTGKYNRELEEALNPLSMVKELYGKARDAFRPSNPLNNAERDAMQRMTESGAKPSGMDMQKFRDAMMKSGRSQRDIDSLMSGQGAVTETERSVTVSPVGKRRGGRAC